MSVNPRVVAGISVILAASLLIRSLTSTPASPQKAMMFSFTEKVIDAKRKKFFAQKYDQPITFDEALKLLEDNDTFRTSFIQTLKVGVDYPAYFFETPGMSQESSKVEAFEFYLGDAPDLARSVQDEYSFKDYFKPNCDVVSFYNLGGDAKLVVPCPVKKGEAVYTHLALFNRQAPEDQVQEYWKQVAKAMRQELQTSQGQTRWMSTNGMGVSWLHMRLDSVPKYYTYQPYKSNSKL